MNNMYDDRHGYKGDFSLYRCLDCGFIQTEPRLEERRIQAIYSEHYPRDTFVVDEVVSQRFQMPSRIGIYWKGMATACHFLCDHGKRVLDIGCGRCDSIRYLLLMNCDAYGVEPDVNIKSIVDRLGIKVKVGLLYVKDYPKEFFDVITMSQVLEHVHEPVTYLRSLRRILARDGKIIMSIPNAGSLLAWLLGRRWIHYHIPYHMNHFSAETVKVLAGRAGYQIKEIRYVTPNRWLGYQVYNLLFRAGRGEKSPFWSRTRDYRTMEKVVVNMIGITEKLDLLAVFARGLDMCRQGESLVVTMSK